MRALNFLSVFLLIISILSLKVTFGGIAGSRNSINGYNFRQDEPGGEPSSANDIARQDEEGEEGEERAAGGEGEESGAEGGEGEESAAEGGEGEESAAEGGEGEESAAEGGEGEAPETETTTIDPDTIKGPDRFLYGWAALAKASDVLFQEIIDKKVEQKVKLLEDFMNLIHDLVHVDGPVDYHEAAYITEKQKKK